MLDDAIASADGHEGYVVEVIEGTVERGAGVSCASYN